MKGSNSLLLIVCMATACQAGAYGGGSGGGNAKSCAKPKFSQFQPEHHAVVAAAAKFSFLVSPNTEPNSIAVTVKGQPVDVTISKQAQGFLVEGRLPERITGDFARINITADGHNHCHGNDGWLLQVQ